MPTIYKTGSADYFATGQLQTTIFPSGLIKAEQLFITPKDGFKENTANLKRGNDFPLVEGISGQSSRSTPNVDTIAYDGIKIYPDPQFRFLPEGFAEILVSGYGRQNKDGIVNFEYKFFERDDTYRITIGTGENQVTKDYQVTAFYKILTKVVQKVIKTSEVANFEYDFNGISPPELIAGIEGNVRIYYWQPHVSAVKFTEFGDFTEVIYTAEYMEMASTEIPT